MKYISAFMTIMLLLLVSGCTSVTQTWTRAKALDSIKEYELFLRKYPDSPYTLDAKKRIEQLKWQQANNSNTVSSYQKFLKGYPDSQYAAEAKAKITDFSVDAWEKTLKEGKWQSYSDFLVRFPESKYAEKAKAQIKIYRANQKANRAIVKIRYPRSAKYTGNYRWRWNTVFEELSGKSGCTLHTRNFYISTIKGRLSNSWKKSVKIGPKGRTSASYWCYGKDLFGGYYHVTWTGKDDWGNIITIKQTVKLK